MDQVEPMDIDNVESDFDDKENSLLHSNVLPRTPCTEKGYEELDVSELNMKLRYSITPASSPMSKSFTANCKDNKTYSLNEDSLNNTIVNSSTSLTRSLNATITQSDVSRSSKLPLQALPTDQYLDMNSTLRRSLDNDPNNITISVNENDIDENISLPSTASSAVQTPEAMTPTKEIHKDGGSPIMRGLKSVLNMFRTSQSPIPPEDNLDKKDPIEPLLNKEEKTPEIVLASTPKACDKNKENLSKRSSPLKDSLTFNDDLEKELQWKDDSILFKHEKIPIHKLFLQETISSAIERIPKSTKEAEKFNSTVEYMDISYNDSVIADRTMTDIGSIIKSSNTKPSSVEPNSVESDCEFLDCETTYTKIDDELEQLNKTIPVNIENIELLQAACADKDVSVHESQARINNIAYNTEVLSKDVSSHDVNVPFKEQKSLSSTIEDDTIDSVINDLQELIKEENNSLLILSKDLSTIDSDVKVEQKSITLDNAKPESVITDIHEVNPDEEEKENNTQLILSEDLSHIDGNVKFEEMIALPTSLVDVKPENEINDIHDLIISKENNVQITSSKDLSSIDSTYKHIQAEEQKSLASTLDSVMPKNVLTDIHGLIPDKNEDDVQLEELKTLSGTCIDVKPENETNDSCGLADVAIECKKESNLKVDKDVTSVLEVSTDKTESNNQEDLSNICFPQNSENNDIELDDIAQDKQLINNLTPSMHEVVSSTELALQVTQPLNIVTVDDNTLAKVYEKSNNSEIIGLEKLEAIDLNYQQVNSGILQICTNKTGDIVHDHANTTLDNQDLESESVNLEDNKIDNQVVAEKSEVIKNSSFASTNDEINHDHTKDMQNKSDSVESSPLNDTFDILLLNKQPDLKEDKIGCGNLVENEVQSSLNETIKNPIVINDSESNVSQPCDNIPRLNDKSLQLIDPQVAKLISSLPSDIDLPSDDDIEKDSLMDNFDTQNENVVEAFNDVYSGSFSIKDQIMDSLEPMDLVSREATTINFEHSNEIIEMLPTANLDEVQKNIEISLNLPTSSDETNNKTVVLDESACEIANNEPTFLDTTQKLNKTDTLSEDKTAPIATNEDHENINCEQIIENFILEEGTKIINEELKNDDGPNDNKLVEEEIVTSANNSPFVSVENLDLDEPKNVINLDEIESPFETKTKIQMSPPISPKLNRQNTYNINFDEIDDPFATKTKIRMSPTPETSPNTSSAAINIMERKPDIQKKVQQQNRRKSQPERQKRDVAKKSFNSSYSCDTRGKNYKEKLNTTRSENDNKNVINENYKSDTISTVETLVGADQVAAENIDSTDDKCELDNVSSSDNSPFNPNESVIIQNEISIHTESTPDNTMEQKSIQDYVSAAKIPSKNVFNLPEIDDMNFNPFATKSKIRSSPSPSFERETELFEDHYSPSNPDNETTQRSVANTTVDVESQEDDIEPSNVISETLSSENTDKDIVLKEIATEDEDTVEGPFLEAEDFADVVKVSDFASEKDMMQFEDYHTAANPEVEDDGELFIDAEAFEFLLNQNKSNEVADSAKESLFLKFDPLFARRISSDGVLSALNKIQKRQSTPKKTSSIPNQNVSITEERPSVSATNCNMLLEESNDENNVTITKPMMVVNPAINSLVSPRKSTTPPRINRRSLTFTSPAMAVIDRLLSLSGNSSTLDHDASPPRVSREYNDTNIALTQLRELLAEKEIHVHNLRSESKELKERLAVMESQVKTLEKESEERLNKVNSLNERLADKTKINKNMSDVVEEYERTIASLVAEINQIKTRNEKERARIISERDEQTAHLSSMEVSFSDLHSKYEKSKQIILSMKANEDTYKKSLKDFEDNVLKMQKNYELLKQHATTKLNNANQELEKFHRAHESEILKLNAMIKRKEIHITSLEESLSQKAKANEELTAICDELINKVG